MKDLSNEQREVMVLRELAALCWQESAGGSGQQWQYLYENRRRFVDQRRRQMADRCATCESTRGAFHSRIGYDNGSGPYSVIYPGILKSLNPTVIFSEITSAGGSRRLFVEGKNPDLRHLNLFSRVTSRPVRAISPR